MHDEQVQGEKEAGAVGMGCRRNLIAVGQGACVNGRERA